MASNGKLTTRQRKAVAALLSTATVEEAAGQAQVGARTLHRWLAEDAAFRSALAAAEGQAIDTATRRLVALQDKAIRVFEDILDGDDDTSPWLKLNAARAALDYLLRLRELHTTEARLAKLEEVVYEERQR